MFSILEVSQDPKEWFDNVQDKNHVHRVLAGLEKYVIMNTSSSSSQLIEKLEGLNPGVKKVLQDWLRLVPKSKSTFVSADYVVGLSLDEGTFLEFIDNDIREKGKSFELLMLGDSYDRLWDEAFSKLAKSSKSVNIYDRYAYKLLEDSRGKFLQNLLKIPNLEVNLHTEIDMEDRSSYLNKAKAEKVLDSWNDFLVLHRDLSTKKSVSRLYLYHPTYKEQHDRVIVFSFESSKVALLIAAGIEEFDGESASSPKIIESVRESNWINQLMSVWANVPGRQKVGQRKWVGITKVS